MPGLLPSIRCGEEECSFGGRSPDSAERRVSVAPSTLRIMIVDQGRWLPRLGRTLWSHGPLRLVVFDTSVLTSDIIATLERRERSSLLAGMSKGTVRGFITREVW